MGTDPCDQRGWEQDGASAGRAVEQTNRLKAISWCGCLHRQLRTKLRLTQARLFPGSGS